MTKQQQKAQILDQIKQCTNSGRHREAMGLYEQHFSAAARPREDQKR